jgi:peptidoglycan/xylan/chitin deacetylase (PgdA/CDA1 family)
MTGIFVLIFLLLFITAFAKKSNIVMVNEIVPITKGNTERKVVAFACNVYEGEQVINNMIKTLEDKQVKMSFFLGGIWVEKNSSLVKMLYEKGYDLQNHGYYHKRPSTLNKQRHISEVKDTEEIIFSLTGHLWGL